MALDAGDAVVLIAALHAALGQQNVTLLEGLNAEVAVNHAGRSWR